ncbi:MAG: aldehyde dehydrogenase family protein [Chloroflexi bacterium]|nr:aldehyde dehydrogenase family protein [Chloroflexota bacterium]
MATQVEARTYKNYIDGQWVDSTTGETFPNINPATGEVLGYFPKSGKADIDRAVAAAQRAFARWRAVPAPRRAEILFRAGELLVQRKEEYARGMSLEMGKVLKEARGDVQEAIDMTYFMAGEGRRLYGHTTPSELPDKLCLTFRMPIGVVAAITPWNFPMAIPSWKLMPALIAGNTVVFKPSTWTPQSAYNLIAVLEEAGLPPGVVNLVFEREVGVSQYLVEHPGVSLVSFTGSTATGTAIATICARQNKRYSLELGGKNAVIVLADADLDLAMDGIVWSAFGTTGQRCTAASRIIVERPLVEEVQRRLVERARALRLGSGVDPQTDVGPVINEEQLKKIRGYMDIGRAEGARLLCGGEIARDGDLGRGYFFQPTVFADVRPDMRIAQEEIFGPVTDIIPVDSPEEAVRVNNATPYGLVTSVFTRDVTKAMRAVEGITTGLVYVNAGTIGAEVHLPFGGTRNTGNGHREGGIGALDVFTEWKTVYIDYSGRLQKAQIDVA